MALNQNEINVIMQHVKDNTPFIDHNAKLFDIYEGDLLTYIYTALERELSPESYKQIQQRVAPINLLQRLVGKLATIYDKAPGRVVFTNGELSTNQADQDLLTWYERESRINVMFNLYNEFFNTFKNSLAMPFVHKGIPRTRIVPSNQFLPYSDDPIDPTNMTHLIVFMGKRKVLGVDKSIFHIYTDEEFLPVTEDGDVIPEILEELNNPNGINPFKKIPAVYINKSLNKLIPQSDTDLLRMVLLIPILISDINFAVKFQAFSIIYGINVNDENLTMSPNAFWKLKSDDPENEAKIGSIKPNLEIEPTLTLIQAELGFWLETKGIKVSGVGDADGTNFQSGIAKIIDEMDTFEFREKQIRNFKASEKEYWDLIINNMHPVWQAQGLLDTNLNWTPGAYVETEFHEQRPLIRRKELLEEVKQEMDLGVTTKKRALKKLNPELSDAEIDELVLEIDEEKTVEIQEMQENFKLNAQNAQPDDGNAQFGKKEKK